ncbi:conserved hypothetical protein [Vibrio crassostreae]|uniref:Uncharacterized protein n=3 Tax=Vibrio TaxID=662 RepID=A0A822MV25_9VIBR|nr:hypothetical protein VS_2455 [Vibrio atlanticus]CDS97050.1 conserved hypothetical protein [Vibrio crassostreae]CDT18339.1 conserved hypothetical protein [Vibrio coralliirubri]CDT16520.1 conserved hypothetical protein [Vibrio crassostreae]CDT21440.1 conserved hypothetical protein [Vibrio coralliirubri]
MQSYQSSQIVIYSARILYPINRVRQWQIYRNTETLVFSRTLMRVKQLPLSVSLS